MNIIQTAMGKAERTTNGFPNSFFIDEYSGLLGFDALFWGRVPGVLRVVVPSRSRI
jgi:hypothetical protein